MDQKKNNLSSKMDVSSSEDDSSENFADYSSNSSLEDNSPEHPVSEKESDKEYETEDDDGWTFGWEEEKPAPPDDYFNTKVEFFSHTEHGMAVSNAFFDGAKISSRESDCLIAGFAKCQSLDDEDTDHLLRLIDCHLPAQKAAPKVETFKKFSSYDPKTRYFCSESRELTPDVDDVDDDTQPCKCGQLVSSHGDNDNNTTVIQLSIVEQITQIMQDADVASKLRKECEENDVVSGEFYKQLRAKGVIQENDLTLQLNIGCVSHTENEHVYAIQAYINELPYDARIHNGILYGIFFGKKLPKIDIILKPFVSELKNLHEEGIPCMIAGLESEVRVKVHTILCPVATKVRPKIQGIVSWDGCSFCLIRPENKIYTGEAQPRSGEQHIKALKALKNLRKTNPKVVVQGVWKDSVLRSLPVFDIVKSFTPNYVDLITALVTSFWGVWTTSKGKNYFISEEDRSVISRRLEAIRPTDESAKIWNVDETKATFPTKWNFLMYYSLPCLQDMLPEEYLDHWFLLVYSVTIFSKRETKREELLNAQRAIRKFVEQIPELYPGESKLCTNEIHQLLHLPKAVQDFGALWASSTMPYDRFKTFFHEFGNTKSIPQLCQSFLIFRGMHTDDWSDCGKKLFDSMCGDISSIFNSWSEVKLLDKGEAFVLCTKEKLQIERKLGRKVERDAKKFHRVVIRGRYFEADQDFCEDEESGNSYTDNSLAKTDDGNVWSLSRVYLIKILDTEIESCVLYCEPLADNFNTSLCGAEGISSDEIMTLTCREDDPDQVVLARDVRYKCVSVPYNNSEWRHSERLVCVIPLVDCTIFRLKKEEEKKLKSKKRDESFDFPPNCVIS